MRVIVLSRLRNGANSLAESSRGSDSEPIFPRILLSPLYRNLQASKTTLILKFLEKFFVASYFPVSGACICLASPFPYSNMEGQKTTSYFSLFEKLSLLLYRTVLRQKVNTGLKNSFYSCTATSSGDFSTPNSKILRIPLYSLTATSEAEKRHRFLKVLRKVTN